MLDKHNTNTTSPEEGVDIIFLVKYLLSKRKYIIYSATIMLLICIAVYLCKPKEYTSKASILPVSQNSSVTGNMGMLASMAGVNIKSPSSSVITPDLYPAVASSTPFMKKLMNVPLKWKDNDSIMSTLIYAKHMKPSAFDYIKAYTIGLPNTIKKWVSPPTQGSIDVLLSDDSTQPEYLVLKREERKAISLLSDMISVEEDPNISAINVTATCELPEQAAILASSSLNILQAIITEYKTKRSKLTLTFLEARYKETQEEYEKVRKLFFAYKDSHRNMIDERVDIEYQQLSDQYQISYSILKTLANQLEEAKLGLMEESPVFSVLQPAVLPNDNSSPRLPVHIVAGIMLGLIFSIGWFIVQLGYFQVFDEKKYLTIKAQFETNKEEA